MAFNDVDTVDTVFPIVQAAPITSGVSKYS